MANNKENSNRFIAWIASFVFHGLIILFLYLFVIKTPIPPFPESGSNGLEVNFGLDANGLGDDQPTTESEIALNNKSSEPPSEAMENEEVITQEVEESVEIENKKAEKKPVKKKKDREKTEVKPIETKVEAEPKKNVEEPKKEPIKETAVALYKGKKNNNSKSEGEKGGTGDQGDPNGNPDVKYHGKKTGTGNGDGNGNGNGDGDGEGPGGNGKKAISFTLTGRKSRNLPIPKADFDESGSIVVEITVNKEGSVIKAKPGVKGSTTLNPTLMDIAKRAALSAKFSANNDAPEEQKGTITYNFILSR